MYIIRRAIIETNKKTGTIKAYNTYYKCTLSGINLMTFDQPEAKRFNSKKEVTKQIRKHFGLRPNVKAIKIPV